MLFLKSETRKILLRACEEGWLSHQQYCLDFIVCTGFYRTGAELSRQLWPIEAAFTTNLMLWRKRSIFHSFYNKTPGGPAVVVISTTFAKFGTEQVLQDGKSAAETK